MDSTEYDDIRSHLSLLIHQVAMQGRPEFLEGVIFGLIQVLLITKNGISMHDARKRIWSEYTLLTEDVTKGLHSWRLLCDEATPTEPLRWSYIRLQEKSRDLCIRLLDFDPIAIAGNRTD